MNLRRIYFAIPAAGRSLRFSETAVGIQNKLFSEIDAGLTVLEASVDACLNSGVAAGLVLAVGENLPVPVRDGLLKRCKTVGMSLEFVAGGDSRQESVFSCLAALKDRADYVLIHDAARPLCAKEDIYELVQGVFRDQAALLARPVVASLKLSEDGNTVTKSVERSTYWEAETPQGFYFPLIYQAHKAAIETGLKATDDAQLVEATGQAVTLIPSRFSNLKITNAEDLIVARALWNARKAA